MGSSDIGSSDSDDESIDACYGSCRRGAIVGHIRFTGRRADSSSIYECRTRAKQ